MADLNSYNCTGRLGADPELRYTPNGKAVVSVNIAVGGINDEVTWVRANFWEKTAETLNQYCQKGHRVGLSGRLTWREWETPEGQRRTALELTVTNLTLLQPRQDNDQGSQGGQRQGGQQRQQQGNQRQQGQQRQQQAPRNAGQGQQRQGQRNPQQQGSQGGWQRDNGPSNAANLGWGNDTSGGGYEGDDLSIDEIPF